MTATTVIGSFGFIAQFGTKGESLEVDVIIRIYFAKILWGRNMEVKSP